MLYFNYTVGFLIASILQGAIIILGEILNLSKFKMTPGLDSILIYLIIGQMAGYLLMYLMTFKPIRLINPWLLGTIYGIFLWYLISSFVSTFGILPLPWTTGISTSLVSLLAFIVYGLIACFTIKKYTNVMA
ncbi:hypothetical protein [Halothermothrix orenii]|uniref:Uncharacterized protein n=1 Tax=Halothermothrix orenii (strain H 168 / OCM 544 / DSM 9562) TaxID=373903 RepID=B8CY27_HALOH|nr:hypothetical protein [Halothermothrix orenii]ACL70196.1 hypothetical protein Hore_14470 [Halothermothrix orenii H 168]